MRVIRTLLIQARCALTRPAFFCAVGLFLAAAPLNSLVLFGYGGPVTDIILHSGYSITYVTVSILPCLAFALSHSTERSEDALIFYHIRVGSAAYTCCKYAAVVISGFCVVFFGYALFVLLLSVFFPLGDTVSSTICYSEFVHGGHPLLFIFFYVLDLSLSGALCAGICMTAAMFVREKYVPILAPYITYMLLLFVFQAVLGVPERFCPSSWMLTVMALDTPAASILTKLAITAAIHILCVCICVRRSGRGVRNG